MGVSYSYTCTKASKKQRLFTYGAKELWLCGMQFEDENGHALVPVDALVILDEGSFDGLCEYPEDMLEDENADSSQRMTAEESARWDEVQKLCEQYPSPTYDVYNSEEMDDLLKGEASVESKNGVCEFGRGGCWWAP